MITSLEQAVIDSPFDVDLRLVWADWLDDHYEREKALLVRNTAKLFYLPAYKSLLWEDSSHFMLEHPLTNETWVVSSPINICKVNNAEIVAASLSAEHMVRTGHWKRIN